MSGRIVFLFAFAAVCLSSSTSAAQHCPATRQQATIFFGNGVWTSDTIDDIRNGKGESYVTLIELEEALAARVVETRAYVLMSCVHFALSFNRSGGSVTDLIESTGQIHADRTSLWNLMFGANAPLTQFVELVKPVLGIQSIESIIEGCDADFTDGLCDLLVHLAAYIRSLPSRSVVVLAHSQGNLFANDAFAALSSMGVLGSYPATDFRVVGVATPAGSVGGESSLSSLRSYVTLVEDHVANGVFPLVNGSRLGANLSNGILECLFAPDPRCHSFDRYINGVKSGPAILDAIIERIPGDNERPTARFDVNVSGQIVASEGAGVTVPTLSGLPVEMTFDASMSTDPEQRLSDWIWSIDGQFASRASQLSHAFDIGTYLVTLRVFDHRGRDSEALTSRITVVAQTPPSPPHNQVPVARFLASVLSRSVLAPGELRVTASPLTGQAVVTFQDISTDPNGPSDIESRRWEADSGCTPSEPPPCLMSDGLTTFQWGFHPGHYQVTLTVRDKGGLSSLITAPVVVLPPSPLVSGISPPIIAASASDQPVSLIGNWFQSGLTVRVGLPGGGASTLSGTQIPSVTKTRADLLVTFADHGSYTFTVVNPDGQESGPFVVNVDAPSSVGSGTITRVNIHSNGSQATGGGFLALAASYVTRDGRFVAFTSSNTSLTAEFGAFGTQVFLRDRVAGTTTLVSRDSAGAAIGGAQPSVSDDGNIVVFRSGNTVWAHDRRTDETQLVAVTPAGQPANGIATHPVVSGDGRYVFFQSVASDLVLFDANGTIADVFRRDLWTGTTELVSVDSSGAQGQLASVFGRLTAANDGTDPSGAPLVASVDGRFVVFASLSALDGMSPSGLYVRDMWLWTTTAVRADTDFGVAPMFVALTTFPTISDDGRYVAFITNFPSFPYTSTEQRFDTCWPAFEGDYGQKFCGDVYVWDMNTNTAVHAGGTLGALSQTSSPSPSGGGFFFAGGIRADSRYRVSLSGDGRYVAFTSNRPDFVAGDANQLPDVFVYDIATRQRVRVSMGYLGDEANAMSHHAMISRDGRHVVFTSGASNLVSDDTNSWQDVFLWEMGP